MNELHQACADALDNAIERLERTSDDLLKLAAVIINVATKVKCAAGLLAAEKEDDGDEVAEED